MDNKLKQIASSFLIDGTVASVTPLGDGLINDTYLVKTAEPSAPNYVLQRINHHIFTNVPRLQKNIEAVTSHIRKKLEQAGTPDIDRRVLRFIKTPQGTTFTEVDGEFWRMSLLIPDSVTSAEVTPHTAELAGEAFGNFQAMLADLPEPLHEIIPDFHNMEFRLTQLRDAVTSDPAGRAAECRPLLDIIEQNAQLMCRAEQLHRQGILPKRACHCDTKVANMLFSPQGDVLCVIDLDTVMPSFVTSDFGDFLRTAACTTPEDHPVPAEVKFRLDIFKPFAKGYLRSASSFLTPVEKELLPWGAMLFPFMQAVRFLADYINGDTYYKISYPSHNLVRTQAQLAMFQSVKDHLPQMREYMDSLA